MSWVPTDPPPGATPAVPPPPVRNPTGWGPPPNPVQKGVCYRCHRPGHYVAECPGSPAHMNVAVPCVTHQYIYPLHYGGSCLQESPHDSGGYTSVVAPPPQPSSHNQTNDGSCVPTFNPHLLTAQFAQEYKDGRSGIFGGNGKEQWVADSGATFHVTGNPVGMVE